MKTLIEISLMAAPIVLAVAVVVSGVMLLRVVELRRARARKPPVQLVSSNQERAHA